MIPILRPLCLAAALAGALVPGVHAQPGDTYSCAGTIENAGQTETGARLSMNISGPAVVLSGDPRFDGDYFGGGQGTVLKFSSRNRNVGEFDSGRGALSIRRVAPGINAKPQLLFEGTCSRAP